MNCATNEAIYAQQELPPYILCGEDTEIDADTEFSLHPLLMDPNDPDRDGDENWSTLTGYGGCPSVCNNGFDCCITQPCKEYNIPVVFTLLNDSNCGNNNMTADQLDDFLQKINSYFDCSGAPFNFYKANYWDDSDINYRGNPITRLSDESTRIICNSDYNQFYLNSLSDGPPTDPNGNLFDDFQEVKVFNVPNVMNIYIPGNYNGYTGRDFISEGGIASFPTGNIDSYGLAFGIDGLNNTISDCTGAQFGSTVAQHEMGHWFGLTHTHGFVNNLQVNFNDPNANYWAECADGTECCTSGDFICDTDPDPNLGTGTVRDSDSNILSSCVTATDGCGVDASLCYSPCGKPYKTQPNTFNNLMSYAYCNRHNLSPCQVAKMVDGLLCSRSDLVSCDPNFADTDNAIPYTGIDEIHLCVGDNVPVLSIINPSGGAANPALDVGCIGWYLSGVNTLDFIPVGTGLSFNPSSFVNSSFPGEYTFYFDDDLGKYTTTECDDQLRKGIKIIVSDYVGNATVNSTGSYNITDCNNPETINLSTNIGGFDEYGLIGWWITEDQPITNQINNNANFLAAVSSTSISDNIANPLNTIIPATSGNPRTNLSLEIDCAKLDNSKTYFATPVASKSYSGIPDVSCTFNYTSITSAFLDDTWPIQWIDDPLPGFVECQPELFDKCLEFNIKLTVTGYTGSPFDMLIDVREGGSIMPLFTYEEEGNGVYYLTEENFAPCYDINSLGIAFIIYERNQGNGAQTASLTAEIEVIYPGEDPIQFPNLTSYSVCIIGEAASFSCSCQAEEVVCPTTNNASQSISICTDDAINNPNIVLINGNGNQVNWSTGGSPIIGIELANFDTHSNYCNVEIIRFRPYVLCDYDANPATAEQWTEVLNSNGGSVEYNVSIYPDPSDYQIQIIQSQGCEQAPLIVDSRCPSISYQGWATDQSNDDCQRTYRWDQQLPTFVQGAPSACRYQNQSGTEVVSDCSGCEECPTVIPMSANLAVCHNGLLDVDAYDNGFNVSNDEGQGSSRIVYTIDGLVPSINNSNVININGYRFSNTNCEVEQYYIAGWYPCDIDGNGFSFSNTSDDHYISAGVISLQVYPNSILFELRISLSNACDIAPTIIDSYCPTLSSQGWTTSPPNDDCQRNYEWNQVIPSFVQNAPTNCNYINQSGSQLIIDCAGCEECPRVNSVSANLSICHNQLLEINPYNYGFNVSDDSGQGSSNLVWTVDGLQPNVNSSNIINLSTFRFSNTNCAPESYYVSGWFPCEVDNSFLSAGGVNLQVYPNPELFVIKVSLSNTCDVAPTIIDSQCPTLASQEYDENPSASDCHRTYRWDQALPDFTNNPPMGCTYPENDGFEVVTNCNACIDCPEVSQVSGSLDLCHNSISHIDAPDYGFRILSDPNDNAGVIIWTDDSNVPKLDRSNIILLNTHRFSNTNCEVEENIVTAWLQCDRDGNGFSTAPSSLDGYVNAGQVSIRVYPDPSLFEISVGTIRGCEEAPIVIDSQCPTLRFQGWQNQSPKPGCSSDDIISNNPTVDTYVWSQMLPAFAANAPEGCAYTTNSNFITNIGCEYCSDCASVAPGYLSEEICHLDSPTLSLSQTGYHIISDPGNTSRDIVWTSDENQPNNTNVIFQGSTFRNTNCNIEIYNVTAWLQCDVSGNGFSDPLGSDDSYVFAGTMELSVYPDPDNYAIQVIPSIECGQEYEIIDSHCPTLYFQGWKNQGPHPGCILDDLDFNNPRMDEYVWTQRMPGFLDDAPGCEYIANDGSAIVQGCTESELVGQGGDLTLCNSGQFTNVNFFTMLSGSYLESGVWGENSSTLSGVDISYPYSVNFLNTQPGVYSFSYTIATATGCIASTNISVTVTSCAGNNLSSPVEILNVHSSEGSRSANEVEFKNSDNSVSDQFVSNYPNPFESETKLDFNLVKDKQVSFSFYSMDGQLILNINDLYLKGKNTISVQANQLLNNNLIYCEMKTDTYSAIKKLVILK